MICCIIPAYKARATVCDVVRGVLPYVDDVIVVDDACPEGSGDAVESAFSRYPSVRVVRRSLNGGVGAATKTGIEEALALDCDIVIKLDADDQMDPAYIPSVAALFDQNQDLAFVKGNRFFDPMVAKRMPSTRLFGNSLLSLLVKFASGYWNILDPTNGYIAFSGRLLSSLNWRGFANDYFFEISILCELGRKRAEIAEIQMETIYNSGRTSLSIPSTILSFPPRLASVFMVRLIFQYFVFDVNLGSLYILFGLLLCTLSTGFLTFEWAESLSSGIPRTPGTVMLGVLPFLIGFQLLLNALLYDVQFAPRCQRELVARRSHSRRERIQLRDVAE